jgi:endonuclease YncB( thermonuclease family)
MSVLANECVSLVSTPQNPEHPTKKRKCGKFGRILAEVWVSEDGKWTNVNKWMCDNAYAVPYSGQNKKDVEALHELNRTKLRVRGEVQ